MPTLAAPTRFLDPHDPDYPRRLLDLATTSFPGTIRWPHAPRLYIRGELPRAPVLGIVGTRTPALSSIAWTEQLVGELRAAGWAIGSGGAEGIDEVAHRAAIAHGLPTIVVTVGGLDSLQKRKDGALCEAVLEAGGALLSLDDDGTRNDRTEYFRRNHVLAALATGLLAVELRPKVGHGGTGHTARAALALGRSVMTLAHPPWSPGGAATVALTRLGVPLVASPADVRRALGMMPVTSESRPIRRTYANPSPSKPSPSDAESQKSLPYVQPAALSAEAARMLQLLEAGPAHLDTLVLATGFAAPRVVRALLECCLEQLVSEDPPGTYGRLRSHDRAGLP